MKLTKEQIKHVAKLANLPLSFEEEKKYGSQLSEILNYIDLLDKVDTSGVEPTFNVTGLSDVLRGDDTRESLTSDQALQNASNKKDGMFITKGVFKE